MDWSNPEERLALIERVGINEYNRLADEHRKATIVSTVNGYAIRPVNTAGYGQLFFVEGTRMAFPKQAEAENYAAKQPAKIPPPSP